MKSLSYLFVAILFISCNSNPNKYYIDKVAEKVQKNDMGLKVTYRNVEFNWIDTMYITGADGNPTENILGYQARNTYRLIVGDLDQEVTAIVTFDHDFNVIDLE